MTTRKTARARKSRRKFDAVKTFSCTKHREREQLGERITDFIRQLPAGAEIVGKAVVLSSDAQFHCFSVVLYLRAANV